MNSQYVWLYHCLLGNMEKFEVLTFLEVLLEAKLSGTDTQCKFSLFLATVFALNKLNVRWISLHF